MNVQEELQDLRDSMRDLSPAERELAVRVSADIMLLTARRLAGDEVGREMAFAVAGAAGLSGAARERAAKWLNDRFTAILTKTISTVLVAAV